jgi:hypothetical protein
MGNPKNITNKTFEEAAKASGKKSDEAKKNVRELLEKQQARSDNSNRKQLCRADWSCFPWRWTVFRPGP